MALMSRLRLGGLGITQDAPIHIGPEVFASDNAARRALNRWAMVCRDLPVAGLPLVDGGARYAQTARELCLGTNDGRSPVNGVG